MKSTRRVLGHLLLRSLVRLYRSLIRLLRTAHFARALRCAHSFARSLTDSGAHGKGIYVCELNASISYTFCPLRRGLSSALKFSITHFIISFSELLIFLHSHPRSFLAISRVELIFTLCLCLCFCISLSHFLTNYRVISASCRILLSFFSEMVWSKIMRAIFSERIYIDFFV